MATTIRPQPPASREPLLHTAAASEVDPITYEVIRHRLWNLNREQATTLIRLSGSPSAIYAYDFNPVVFTETGELVYFGPFLQYLAVGADNAIDWTMKNRVPNPGIDDGDIFMSSDPWISVQHAQDVLFQCPVFVDGKIFCWVSNTLHQYDIGGSTPGGFSPEAKDVHTEVAPWPPIKVVEDFEIRRDIEDLHVRRSRVPHLVSLDLRATVAGLWAARKGVLDLVEKYGPEVVKGVMRKVIDDSEEAFVRRLDLLPDGIWEERSFFESSGLEDRGVYETRVQLEKRGRELVWRNHGTHEQLGSLNMPPVAFRGAIMAAVAPALLYDQLFAVGGALRHLRFELDPGTITAAEYPAATSCGPPVAIVRTTCMATVCLGKMVVSDPGLAREANAPGGPGAFPNVVLSGSSRTGEPYMNWMIDPLSGSIGAFSWRDGVSTGGQLWNPLGTIPNVEHEEQMHPYIYLFRKELPDSGGAGEFRGGNGGVAALKMHKTASSQLSTTINGRAAPATAGMFGGYAGSTNALSLFRESGIDAVFAAGQVPAWPIELGVREIPPNKGNDIALDDDCLLEYSWAGGGGYGDPLKRDPDRVAADLAEGSISLPAASDYFGVVLAADGTVDESSTARLRAELIAGRRAEANGPAAERVHDADALERGRRVHATIRAVSVAGEWRFAGPSGADLGPLVENYKDRCLKRERDVTVVSPLIGDPHLVVDDSFVLREYFDPVDLSLLETEIARPEDPILWDLRPRLEPGSGN